MNRCDMVHRVDMYNHDALGGGLHFRGRAPNYCDGQLAHGHHALVNGECRELHREYRVVLRVLYVLGRGGGRNLNNFHVYRFSGPHQALRDDHHGEPFHEVKQDVVHQDEVQYGEVHHGAVLHGEELHGEEILKLKIQSAALRDACARSESHHDVQVHNEVRHGARHQSVVLRGVHLRNELPRGEHLQSELLHGEEFMSEVHDDVPLQDEASHGVALHGVALHGVEQPHGDALQVQPRGVIFHEQKVHDRIHA